MIEDAHATAPSGCIRAAELFRTWFIHYTPVREKLGELPTKTVEAVAPLFPGGMDDGDVAIFELQADARFPTGWRVLPLSQIILILQGTALSTPKAGAGTDGVPLITLSDMPESGWVMDSTRRLNHQSIDDSKVRLLPRGATLLSNESHSLRSGIVGAPLAFNRSLVGCQGKEGFPDYFVHFLLRACHPEMMRWCFMSGCRYRLDQRYFDEFRVVIPTLELAMEFEKIVTPWMQEDLSNFTSP
jgi:hypothetical protein